MSTYEYKLVRLFQLCNRNILAELGRSFCGSFYYIVTCGHNTKSHRSQKNRVAYMYNA